MPLTNWADWRGAEPLGQFDGLVDGHAVGRFGIQNFVGPQPQHVAIGGRHAVQAPIVGRLRQQLVEFRPIAAHAGHQRPGRTRSARRPQAVLGRN